MEATREYPFILNALIERTSAIVVSENIAEKFSSTESFFPSIAPRRLQDDIRQQGIDKNVITQDGSWMEMMFLSFPYRIRRFIVS